MPFEIPQQEPTIETRVGRYQHLADAMLRGCSWTVKAEWCLVDERLTWLPFVKPRACALGALILGSGGEQPDDLYTMLVEYAKRYGHCIQADNDLYRLTREQIAARIAAL